LSATPKKITPFDGGLNDIFGRSVAVSDDKIIVGADWNDDKGTNSGAAYVYDANNLSAQPTKLTAFDGADYAYFGHSVAATSDKIVVGAYADDGAGSVYVYDANNLSATPTKLRAFDGAVSDWFGYSVAATADDIIVGSINSSSSSLYIYDANDLSAVPIKISPNDIESGDRFGTSVAVG